MQRTRYGPEWNLAALEDLDIGIAILQSFTSEPMNPKDSSKPWITHTQGLGEDLFGQCFVLCPDMGNAKAVREKKIYMLERALYDPVFP